MCANLPPELQIRLSMCRLYSSEPDAASSLLNHISTLDTSTYGELFIEAGDALLEMQYVATTVTTAVTDTVMTGTMRRLERRSQCWRLSPHSTIMSCGSVRPGALRPCPGTNWRLYRCAGRYTIQLDSIRHCIMNNRF